MKWLPFQHQDRIYDLSHLHPRFLTYVQPGKDDKPAREYPCRISYGLHTFTRGIKPGEIPEPHLLYRDSRETRVFDFDRHAVSLHLPEIVQTVDQRKCHHTHYGNFFTVEVMGNCGQMRNYEVYFEVSRAGSPKGMLNLFVQSAYVRDRGATLKKQRIGFFVIAHNILHKKPINSLR